MIEVNLKRIKGNRSCTRGILQIPRFEFKCHTLELTEGSDFLYKQGCCLDEGNYVLIKGFENQSVFFPVLKKKPKGFARKPIFIFQNIDFMHLGAGDIGLGASVIDDFHLASSLELEKKFKAIWENVFRDNKEICVLTIYKSKRFEKSDDDFFKMNEETDLDFTPEDLEEEDD